MKFTSIGFGSRIHLLYGARSINSNLTFVSDSSSVDPIGPWKASLSASPGENWLSSIYGGTNSIMPGSYSNHKPAAWFHDRLYWMQNLIEDTADAYILSWDGSGVHKHGGFTGDNGYNANWRNGRGTDLLSPSGAHTVCAQGCAHIVHNGILFILGAVPLFTTSAGNDGWRTKKGWDVASITNAGDGTNRRNRRKYTSFGIDKRAKHKKDHKFITTPTEFLPNALSQEDTNACDAISWGDDIIFASYCDILKFPGGSGIPELIEMTRNIPSAKSFEIFPSGGFDNSSPVFTPGTDIPDLLVLTGSGVIKQINFVNSAISGTKTIFDLGNLLLDPATLGKNVRTGDSLERISSSAEPARSCYLKSFNGTLHAFIPSAVSGYHYLRCDGDPRLVANWQNKSLTLPDDIKRFDGDIYGSFDEFRNSLYLLHVSKSEYGLWGFIGGQKGAGGMYLTRLDTNYSFTEIYRGVSAEPSVGLIPYNNVGVSAISPSGNGPEVLASTDYALINYKLYSAYPRTCSVTIEYSTDDGTTWKNATQFKSYITGQNVGDGKTGLSASYFGDSHSFYWNHSYDLGCNVNKRCKIRILPVMER